MTTSQAALRGVTHRTLAGVRPSTLVAAIPIVLFILCSVSSDMVAVLGGDPLHIWRLLPAGPVAGDWLGAEVASTAFLLIGIALARGKRVAFWMALAVSASAVVVQGIALAHPVAAALAVLVAASLVASRSRYHVGTGPREIRLAVALLVGAVILAGVAAATSAAAGGTPGSVADAIGSVFDLATPVALPGLATVGAMLVIGHLGYLVATILVLDPVPDNRPADVIAAARRTLRTVGAGSLLPYQLGASCTAFADPEGTAAIAAAAVGRASVALGDPAGEPGAADRLAAAWEARCRRADLVPVVYQASETRAAALRALGWRSCLVGREAVVNPTTFNLAAPALANLRHTVTRSRKGGIRTIWSASGVGGLGDWRLTTGLVRLDREWRRTAGPQLGFTVGEFDPHADGDTAIAVAVDEHDVPVAFAVVRPTGADGGWMLDVMRRAREGVPGAMEACLVTAIAELGASGVTRLSLGLAPLAGLDPASDLLAERLLARSARMIRRLYNPEGLGFFKNKFDPTWEPRYLVVRRWSELLTAVVALLRLHLGGGWPRVIRSVAAGLVPAR
jgi:phosphatidylglycerol lysyltransferase